MRGTIAVISPRREDRERVVRSVGKAFLVTEGEPGESTDGLALIAVGEERLEAVLAALPEGVPPVVVFGRPVATADPRIAHIVRRQVPLDALRALLLSLAEGRAMFAPPPVAPVSESSARHLQRAFALSRRLAAAQDLTATERIAVDAVTELCGADRAACLFFDAGEGSLWSEEKLKGPQGDDRRAVAGIAGFVARTGMPVATAAAADDPRGLPAIDDATERLIAHAVLGARGQVHAVLLAARSGKRPPFGEEETASLGAFAGMIAPFLDQLSTHIETQALLETPEEERLFRQEAIEAQALPRWGDVIRVTPGWVNWAYWALLALLLASVAYISIGTVSTYSAGPAIVRSTSRSEITARTAGNVSEVRVAPGDRIAAGAVIARLDDADARGRIDRTQREFETQLRNHMVNPADAAADAALQRLRLDLERDRLALEERLVRAPGAGVVTDVRVRTGQRVEPGAVVASVSDGAGGLELAALLPGSDRPQLAPGMALRLELSGYRYAYQTFIIESVSEDVIAPGEALRILGPDVVGGMQLSGPVVLVRARIPGYQFEVDGETFRYHDGMQGLAEVEVREERILYALVPGLRRL